MQLNNRFASSWTIKRCELAITSCLGSQKLAARDRCHQLQETWHVSMPFVATGPGTDSAGPGNIKLLNYFGPVFVDHSYFTPDKQ